MTLQELVLKWNGTWKYDRWWRQKHNVVFDSQEHREVTQFQISFEYFEYTMAKKAENDMMQAEKDLELIKAGKLRRDIVDKEKEDELFNKIDLKSFD